MLTSRQKEMLEIINQAPNPVHISYFVKHFKKSIRMLRYDIASLRTYLEVENVEIKTNKSGEYYIAFSERSHVSRILMQEGFIKSEQDNKDQQLQDLFWYFLSRKHKKMFEIEETLYASSSLIFNVIAHFNKQYAPSFKIESIKHKGYQLVGDEVQIRMHAVSLLYEMQEVNIPYISSDVRIVSLSQIKQALKKANTTFHIWMDSKLFKTVVLYIYVAYIRSMFLRSNSFVNQQAKAYTYACYVIKSIGLWCNEQQEIAMLIKILEANDVRVIKKGELANNIVSMIKDMVEELNQSKHNFNYEKLREDLYLHFLHFYENSEHYKIDEQLLLEHLKDEYPHYYGLAKTLSKYFKVYFHKDCPEVEISYIAIYLYKNDCEKFEYKNVIVVCSTGRGLSSLLVTRIQHIFENIRVVKQMSYQEVNKIGKDENIDFIISTIPIKNSKYPIIQITNLLGQADIVKINKLIGNPWEVKNQTYELPKEEVVADTNLAKYSKAISYLIMGLLDDVSSLSKQYALTSDVLLGLTIHILMAIPRWFEKEEENEVYEKMYYRAYKEHPTLMKKMDKFFEHAESILMVSISKSERFAILQYVIHTKGEG